MRDKELTCSAALNRDINFVIMDYLINEGYPSAAKKFAMEANIQPPIEEESIRPRVEIRNAIHAGDIETAIHKINDLNPQVSLSPHFCAYPLVMINIVHAPLIAFGC